MENPDLKVVKDRYLKSCEKQSKQYLTTDKTYTIMYILGKNNIKTWKFCDKSCDCYQSFVTGLVTVFKVLWQVL